MAGKKTVAINAGAVTSENTLKNRTGCWRTFTPIIDLARCTGCGICVLTCPDSCIVVGEIKDKSKIGKKASINYDYCKGCLICIGTCPVKAITSKLDAKNNPQHPSDK